MDNTLATLAIPDRILGLIKLTRPKQWIKNSLVLAPLVFAGLFFDFQAVGQAALAVGLFCLASSAAYIVNDIQDMESDRRHPEKSKTRPLAANIVSISAALFLLSGLYAFLVWGWFMAPKVVMVIVAYLVLNLAYTFVLKHQPVIDIFSIATGFVLRVYAGAVAIDVPVSLWMFNTTLCLALYLAAIKRRQELDQSGTDGRRALKRYSVPLMDRYAEISAAGALIFYSSFVITNRPELAITIPIVLFSLFRYWFVAEVLGGGESPTDALLTDWQLLFSVAIWTGVCGWALWPAGG